MNKIWDVFISHASEDKDAVVCELATRLKRYEISVWYDEFELKVGDSLSKSIDKGLSKSRYGLIILSPSFFEKRWPDYELRSLLTKEINADDKIILPIWHNINAKDVIEYSPYLADKFALTTAMGMDELVYKIIEVIRPDIINSQAIINASRSLQSNGEVVEIPYKNIHKSDIRHKSLPKYLIVGSKLISSIFYDVSGFEFRDYVIDFARDADYEYEFLLWSAMASTYIDFINIKRINAEEIERKKDIYAFLLGYINGVMRNVDDYYVKYKYLTEYECDELLVLYAYNHDQLLEFFDNSMKQKYKKILPDK